MTVCGERCSVKHGREGFTLATLPCRAWTCPSCAPRRRAQLIAEAAAGRPNTFVTLTLPDSWASKPAAAVVALARAWRIIRKRDARRRHGRPLPFFAVVERTRRGTPHLHILTRSKWIDQAWLSECMEDLLQAPIVDVRRIDSAGSAPAYVAKYLGKDPARIGTSKRYWQSRDYAISPPRQAPQLEPGEWWDRPLNHPIGKLVRDFCRAGMIASWDGPHRAVLRRSAGAA